jgi:DNA-binding transcriptional ArsR family regulator
MPFEKWVFCVVAVVPDLRTIEQRIKFPYLFTRMRPLVHPSAEDITVEGILHALSDPVRVAIYADIVASNCSQTCSTFLHVTERAIPKSTLSQHFKALREAGLIQSERRGVEMHNTSRCAEIEKRFPGLIPAIVNAHNIQSARKPRVGNAGRRTPVARGARDSAIQSWRRR